MEFPVVSCPAEFRVVADEFKDILGSHYRAFVAVLCGYLFGISNLSDIVRFLLFSPSVSALGRMFDDNKLYTQLNRRHRRRVLRLLHNIQKNPTRYIFAIDDTLLPHCGQKIWGAYHWSDHGKKTIWGHKLLVLGVVDTKRKVLIPIFWEILHRKDLNEKRVHEKDWEVALKLLEDATSFGFPQFPVVLDSGFSGNEFMNKLTQKGYRFILEIKNNRTVIAHGKKRNIKSSVADFFSNRPRHKIFYLKRPKWAVSAMLQLKGLGQQLKVVAVANKKGLVNECFAYYVSNQTTWDPTKIWGIARDRWAIEVQFRDLKQHFTLGGAAVRSQQAVETSISISMIALTVIRLEQLDRVDAKENQYKRPVSASSIVLDHTLRSLTRGIFKLASLNNTSIIQKFKIRLNSKNFGQKPIITATEEFNVVYT